MAMPPEQLFDVMGPLSPLLQLHMYLDGEKVGLPTPDSALAPEYRTHASQYASFLISAYHDSSIAELIFKYRAVGRSARVAGTATGRGIYLREFESQPLLYFGFASENSDVMERAVQLYGSDETNPWNVGQGFEHIGMGNTEIHIALRLLTVDALTEDFKLFADFIKGSANVFEHVRQRIMTERVGTADEDEIRNRITALQEANAVLANAFGEEGGRERS